MSIACSVACLDCLDEAPGIGDGGFKLPAGYYVTYGGAFENLNAAKQRLMIAVPVSLFLIFLHMQ